MSPRTLHLLLALAISIGQGSAQVERVQPELDAAVAAIAERVFDHLVMTPAASSTGVVCLEADRTRNDLDPLRTASAIDELQARLAERGVRFDHAADLGSEASRLTLRVAVLGAREPFHLTVAAEMTGRGSAFLERTTFVEKPWVVSGPDPSRRYPMLFRVRTFVPEDLESPVDASLDALREKLTRILGPDVELPEAFVIDQARHWELDRFRTIVDDEFGGRMQSTTILYGLTERHLDALRVEGERCARERFSQWVFRIAWILGALALATLSYLHLDWKTRGYVSGPLKVVCFVLFALVASAGLGLS